MAARGAGAAGRANAADWRARELACGRSTSSGPRANKVRHLEGYFLASCRHRGFGFIVPGGGSLEESFFMSVALRSIAVAQVTARAEPGGANLAQCLLCRLL